jgi:hypothetical protein
VGRALGLSEVEIYGMAVVNEHLHERLVQLGFEMREVPCPADLGSSELVTILTRVFEIK